MRGRNATASVLLLLSLSVVATAGASPVDRPALGKPPPEWAANAGSWPSHDLDLAAKGGTTLWKTRAPTGINSFPAVTTTMLIVGAGAPTSARQASKGELVAYALPRRP